MARVILKAFIQHFLLLTSNIFWRRLLGASILKVLSKNSKFLSKFFDEKKNGIRIIGQAAPRPNPIADDESNFFFDDSVPRLIH